MRGSIPRSIVQLYFATQLRPYPPCDGAARTAPEKDAYVSPDKILHRMVPLAEKPSPGCETPGGPVGATDLNAAA